MIPFRPKGGLWDEERLTTDLIYLVEIGLCHFFFSTEVSLVCVFLFLIF